MIPAPLITIDTGISEPVKPVKLITSRTPRTIKKPPTVAGYNWKSDSSGFALRKVVYITDPDTGIRQRKLPRVAHLSKAAFAEMKRRHKGKALDRAIQQWIKDKEAS